MTRSNQAPVLYRTPFSASYWRQAAAEFGDIRVMALAAMMIALRVIFKIIKIPLGPYLDLNTAFVINAMGAMIFGPVVAIGAAAITDTLGCLFFPSGPYFFPFIFIEIAGSVVFALFLYRAEITVGRVILSRFCINFFVNVVLQTPVMALYYDMILGKSYAWIDLPRIVKNLVLFPFEAAVLIIILRYTVPPLYRLGIVKSRVTNMKLGRRTIALLAALFIGSVALAAGYSVYSYNTTSLSASYGGQRAERNEELNDYVLARHPDWRPEDTVTIIESALPRFGSPDITYELAVYRADIEAIAERAAKDSAQPDLEAVRGYSKSKAANDNALTRLTFVTAVIDGDTGEVKSWEETP